MFYQKNLPVWERAVRGACSTFFFDTPAHGHRRGLGPGRGGVACAGWPGYLPHMARTKQSPEFEIEVGGERYVWRLHRRPQWSSDAADWRGMAIAVRHQDGQREAVLEFPPSPQPRHGAPHLQPSQIALELVAKGIASAIAAGWEPLSRGKTVPIVVDASGG